MHGVPEEKGTIGYFDVTDAPSNSVDGVNIAQTKSIDMWNWQKQVFTNLQMSNKDAEITKTDISVSDHDEHSILAEANVEESKIIETTLCEVEEGSAIKSSNKSYYPKVTQIQAGDTITWTNNDFSVHTVTSNDE